MQSRPTTTPQQRAGKVRPAAVATATAPELPQGFERLLDDNELAAVIGRSRSRIQKDRLEGRGPPFVKIGRLVRYRADDVRNYLRSCTIRPAETQAAQSQHAI
jgi:predicted DNA-binding transcriptional regulator AlpA